MKIFFFALIFSTATFGRGIELSKTDQSGVGEKTDAFEGSVEIIEGDKYAFYLRNKGIAPVYLKFNAFASGGNGLAPAGISLELEIFEEFLDRDYCNDGFPKALDSTTLQAGNSRTVRYSSAILGSGSFFIEDSFVLKIGRHSTFRSFNMSLADLFVGLDNASCFSKFRILYETDINGNNFYFKSRWVSFESNNGQQYNRQQTATSQPVRVSGCPHR